MKKNLFLILFFAFVNTCFSQNDTLAQQQRLRDSAQKYTGKPFSVLYNDLTIKPKTVEGTIAVKNIHVEPGHYFYYDDLESDNESDFFFYIEWILPPLKSETRKYQNLLARVFNTQEYPTYKDLIIKKLVVYPQAE